MAMVSFPSLLILLSTIVLVGMHVLCTRIAILSEDLKVSELLLITVDPPATTVLKILMKSKTRFLTSA